MPTASPTHRFVAGLAVAVAGVLAACSGGTEPDAAPVASGSAPAGVTAARCAENRAAGEVTYLTGFQYGGSVSILDVLTAEQKGFYDDVCLDVRIQPGNGGQNAQLASAGRAQLAGLGGPSDTITAVAAGARIVGVATYGNTSAVTLLTLEGSGIDTLKDIEGRVLGYKGAIPPAILAMLRQAGVDLDRVEDVSVGFDPTILVQDKVQALTAYKSNEPLTLRAAGADVREWDPQEYGITSAFNTIVANADFAAEHPNAVEDFLRATFHGFAYTDAHVEQSVQHAAELAGGGYDVEANARQWRAESQLVRDTLVPGHGIGWQSVEQWAPEDRVLREFGLVTEPVDLAAVVDQAPVAAIYDGATLIWPAPGAGPAAEPAVSGSATAAP